MKKLQRKNLTFFLMHKRSVQVQVPLNDGSLPEDIKQLVEKHVLIQLRFSGWNMARKQAIQLLTKKRRKKDKNSLYTTSCFS